MKIDHSVGRPRHTWTENPENSYSATRTRFVLLFFSASVYGSSGWRSVCGKEPGAGGSGVRHPPAPRAQAEQRQVLAVRVVRHTGARRTGGKAPGSSSCQRHPDGSASNTLRIHYHIRTARWCSCFWTAAAAASAACFDSAAESNACRKQHVPLDGWGSATRASRGPGE